MNELIHYENPPLTPPKRGLKKLQHVYKATNHNNIEVDELQSRESYYSENPDSHKKNYEKETYPNKIEPLRIE